VNMVSIWQEVAQEVALVLNLSGIMALMKLIPYKLDKGMSYLERMNRFLGEQGTEVVGVGYCNQLLE
jgi:hypothetical protein